jgi:hypothetical protein
MQILDRDTFNLKVAVHDSTRQILPWVNDLVYDSASNQIIGDFCNGWHGSPGEPLYIQYITVGDYGVKKVGDALSGDIWPVFGRSWYTNMTVYDSVGKIYYELLGDWGHGDGRMLAVGDVNKKPAPFVAYAISTSKWVLQQLVWNPVDSQLYAVATEGRYTNPKLMVYDKVAHTFSETPLASLGAAYMYGPAVADENGNILIFARKTQTDKTRIYELWELSPARGTQRMVVAYPDQSQLMLRAAYAAK